MGHIKALTLASAVMLATAGAAFAADLLPPPPPLAEPPQVEADFSGWYIRGDVGVGINTISSLKSSFRAGFDPVYQDVRQDSKSIGDSAFLRAGVGYQFNNWFRADVTGEYRTSSALRSINSYANYELTTNKPNPNSSNYVQGFCGAIVNQTYTQAGNAGQFGQPRCFDQYTSNVQSAVALLNGYVDLGTWYNLTPYVGAGVGLARNSWSEITDQASNNGGWGVSKTKSKTSLAWALMTGVSYSVTPNLKLEFGYRYLNLGSASSNQIICATNDCQFEVQKLKLASHDLHIGMRWLIGANGHGNGQALYWGENGATSGSLAHSGGYAAAGGYATGGYSGAPIVKRY